MEEFVVFKFENMEKDLEKKSILIKLSQFIREKSFPLGIHTTR